MRLAIDTNAYSAILRGSSAELKDELETADEIMLPFVVIAELKAGFKKGNQEEANYKKLNMFLDMDTVSIAWPNDTTLDLYANLWADLAAKGTPIPTNDVWIAAICLQHNLSLATDDKHFDKVPLLQKLPSF